MKSYKNIVLCSDGTGNTMMKGRGTNVWKLFEAVDLTAHRWQQSQSQQPLGREQVAFYDDGVGSQENKVLKIVGGAFGYGLKRNIRDLYKSLCRAYRPGDQIYIFGFSRGAYTARVLAGMILSCGILKPEYCRTDKSLDEMSRKAYKAFRAHFRKATAKGHRAISAHQKVLKTEVEYKQSGARASNELTQKMETTKIRAENADQEAESARAEAEKMTDDFRRAHSKTHGEHAPDGLVTIRFVGVWDTVAAVGLPFKQLTDFWNRFVFPFKFPDYLLSSRVVKGCHALAIDDERLTFHPMMWDEREEQGEDSEHVEQVWFAGVHSNVGGGYPKQGMSLVSLDWMIQRAEQQGLSFIASERERYRHLQNAHDRLYDSRSGPGIYYRYCPRDIDKICREFGISPKIHVSAMERIALGTQDYAPGNLPAEFTITTTDPEANVPVEDPVRLKKIVDDLGLEVASHKVKRWIAARQYIYLGFLLVTLGVVAIAARHHSLTDSREPWVPASWDASLNWLANLVPFGERIYELLIRPFLIYWNYALVAVLLFGIFYLFRKLIKRKLHNAFAGFWRIKLPQPWW